ncbi:hypothetical protein [Candidatus Cyanaurora vandensis]|uniref:hypothetical protein n=1 Tax=Candidatus Cyanaurora vandensis TaxID=2714958 RepID=UPI00257EECDA|nr:hypothetical protein [Candidatus Cyanaurora vandensis]
MILVGLAQPLAGVPLMEGMVQGTERVLRAGESLTTPTTRADLLFADGTLIRADRGSEFSFQMEREIILTRGALWLRVPANSGGLDLRVDGLTVTGAGGSVVALRRGDGTLQFIALYHDPRGRLQVQGRGLAPQALGIGQVLTITLADRRAKRLSVAQFVDLVPLLKSGLFDQLLTPTTPPTAATTLSPELATALIPALSEIRQALAHQGELLSTGRLVRRP